MTNCVRMAIIGIGCIVIGLATLLVLREGGTRKSIATTNREQTTLAEDGTRLVSIFDRLPPDPRNEPAAFSSVRQGLHLCIANRTESELARIMGIIEPPVAATNCPSTVCGGSRQVQGNLTCSGSGCQGTFTYAHYDADGEEDSGARNDGSFGCTAVPGYQCTENLCDSVVCEVTPRCPGSYECDAAGTCTPGDECNNGCCEPINCSWNDE